MKARIIYEASYPGDEAGNIWRWSPCLKTTKIDLTPPWSVRCWPPLSNLSNLLHHCTAPSDQSWHLTQTQAGVGVAAWTCPVRGKNRHHATNTKWKYAGCTRELTGLNSPQWPSAAHMLIMECDSPDCQENVTLRWSICASNLSL